MVTKCLSLIGLTNVKLPSFKTNSTSHLVSKWNPKFFFPMWHLKSRARRVVGLTDNKREAETKQHHERRDESSGRRVHYLCCANDEGSADPRGCRTHGHSEEISWPHRGRNSRQLPVCALCLLPAASLVEQTFVRIGTVCIFLYLSTYFGHTIYRGFLLLLPFFFPKLAHTCCLVTAPPCGGKYNHLNQPSLLSSVLPGCEDLQLQTTASEKWNASATLLNLRNLYM